MSENIKKGPSKTAEEVTLVRIIESTKPEDERICYDPLAIHFIGHKTLELLQKDPEIEKGKQTVFKGVANTIAARVKYFDDFVKESINEGIEQLVILGAGYDTRAYRIEGIKENVKVFELDHPSTQSIKIEKIKEIFGFLPDHVTYVSIDLEKEILSENLFKNKYDPLKKTLFLMEGLIYYLPPEAVDELLSFIVHSSGEKSAVVFDYGRVKPDTTAHKDNNGYKFAKKRGEPVKSSINEPIEKFLSERGFYKIQNMESEDYKKAYFHGKNANREVSNLASFAYAVVE